MKTYVKTFEAFANQHKSFNKMNESDELEISEKDAKEIYGNLIAYTHILKDANTFSQFLKNTKNGKDFWSKIAGSETELQRTVKESILTVIFKAMDPSITIKKSYESTSLTVALGAQNKRTTSVKGQNSYLEITNKDGVTQKIDILEPFGVNADSNKDFPQDITGFTELFGDITDEEVVKRGKANFDKALSGDVKKYKNEAIAYMKKEENGIFRALSNTTKNVLSGLGF